MQVVILAAGEGRRLRPLTDTIPKPMISLAGKPILEHIIFLLPKQIDEIILVVGYKKEKIREYFGNSYGRFSMKYVLQDAPRGTADALQCARAFLCGDPFLMIHADDLYHPDDLAVVIGPRPCVIVKKSNHPERFGVCLLNKDGTLADILEKMEHPPTDLVNIGIYYLNHEIFDIKPFVLPNGELNLAGQIGAWSKTRPIDVKHSLFWHPIGYPEDLATAEHFINLSPEERRN